MTREEEIQIAAETYTQEIIDSNTFDVNFEENNYDAGSLYATSEVFPMAFIAGGRAMKKIHMEFDLIVTDKSAQELFDASEICMQDNIMEALDVYDECECIENFKMYKVEDEQ